MGNCMAQNKASSHKKRNNTINKQIDLTVRA